MKRRDFLTNLAIGGLALSTGCWGRGEPVTSRHEPLAEQEMKTNEQDRMPLLFVGHGSPMNIIDDNPWSRGFTELRDSLSEPKAILAISAHWFVDGLWLTGDLSPKTIHDFYGFPQPLYEIDYPAPGQPELAKRISKLIEEREASLSYDWGLDHGTWSVLKWLFPEAKIPVVQLSIDRRLGFAEHFRLAQSLAQLRHEGVLILGSGNIVHNLRDAGARMRSGDYRTPQWAQSFDDELTHLLELRDHQSLIALAQSSEARIAHPSPDHLLPLIYAAALVDERDQLSFPITGFDLGSVSMRTALWR